MRGGPELTPCAATSGVSIVGRLDPNNTIGYGEADTCPFRFRSAALFQVRFRKAGAGNYRQGRIDHREMAVHLV